MIVFLKVYFGPLMVSRHRKKLVIFGSIQYTVYEIPHSNFTLSHHHSTAFMLTNCYKQNVFSSFDAPHKYESRVHNWFNTTGYSGIIHMHVKYEVYAKNTYDVIISVDATTTVETTTYSSTDKLVFESTTSETNLGTTIPSTTLSSTTGKTSNGASTAEILSTTETASYDTTEKHSTKNTISKTTIFHLASYSSTKSPVVSQTTEPTHIPGTTSGATPQPSSNVSNHSCHSCSGACCVCSPVLNTTTTATSVDELKTSLTIDKTKTNSYIRKRTSAYDGRVSSMVIGYSGVLFLTVIFSFFVFFDLTNFAMYGYKKCKK